MVGAGEEEEFHVFDVDQTQRCFAGYQDQLFLFFQNHVGGAEQDVFAITVGDAGHGAHGAGDHNHGVGRIGAAGEGCVHAFDGMRLDAFRRTKSAGQFHVDDLLGVVAQNDMDFRVGGVQVVEQALGVQERRWLR